jgi:hypothetical protein
MGPRDSRNLMLICICPLLGAYLLIAPNIALSADELHAKEGISITTRFHLPPSIAGKPFKFAGQTVPLERPDVEARIIREVNLLLLDARGVLTSWFTEKGRFGWIFEEMLTKEGFPKELVLFSAVLSGMTKKSSAKLGGEGWWALGTPCTEMDGIKMVNDSWFDDRLDPEASTRCFAIRMKRMLEEVGGSNWLMAAAAYVSSPKEIVQRMQRWNTDSFWDLPLPENADELVTRWVALGIIDSHRKAYGIKFTEPAPFTYDHVTGVVLTKDLPVPVIARMTGVSSRQILEMNPRVKVSKAVFPARADGRTPTHSLVAPEGKGQALVRRLKEEGYVAEK